MGIRDKTVYNWNKTFSIDLPGMYFKKIRWNDARKELYIIGTKQDALAPVTDTWKVWRSKDRGNTFEEVDSFVGRYYDIGMGDAYPLDLAFDSSGSIYVAGSVLDDDPGTYEYHGCVRKSANGDPGTWETLDLYGATDLPGWSSGWETRYDTIAVDKNSDYVFACATLGTHQNGFVIRRIHATQSSGSFSKVYDCNGTECNIWSMKCSNNGVLYISGLSASTASTSGQFLSKCSAVTANPLVFSNIFKRNSTQTSSVYAATSFIDVHCDNSYIIGGYSAASGSNNRSGSVFYSPNGGTNSYWSFSDYMNKGNGDNSAFTDCCFMTGSEKDTCYFLISNAEYGETRMTSCLLRSDNKGQNIVDVKYFRSSSLDNALISVCCDDENNIYMAGLNSYYIYDGLYFAHYIEDYYNSPFVLKGKRTALSESIGPFTISPSYDETTENALVIDDVTYKKHLANISEFPHDAPYSQMKNTVIGSQNHGTMGRSPDDIIQVNHIGSTVKIFWPKQESVGAQLQSYGDFGVTEKVGKLETSFQPGDSYDVTDFDHLSLYCYLRKELSGTLDNVVITVDRKPLNALGYATEQAIEYTVSGSITEARLKELHYTKEIDYGDLSIKDIGYPIDIPLSNVKEIRISAKHKNGQSGDNSKLIVYGRLIKQDANKTET